MSNEVDQAASSRGSDFVAAAQLAMQPATTSGSWQKQKPDNRVQAGADEEDGRL